MPGPRPAPELTRYDHLHSERPGDSGLATSPDPPGTPLGVLAQVLEHDGQQLSAIQTRNQALSEADHLAVLHAIWTAETTPVRHQHYRGLPAAALPPGHQVEPGHRAQWLWRTLHALGAVPGDPADRLNWQQRAASIGAYRELSGNDHPADPIGAEPAVAAPETRAA